MVEIPSIADIEGMLPSEIVAELATAQARIASLTEALEFYADPENHVVTERYSPSTNPRFGPIYFDASNVSEDDGARARAALGEDDA